MATNATICYLVKGNKILLQKKSKELFGGGNWNGPGGKIKENETPLEGVKREVLEEIGVKISNPEQLGFLKFFKGDEPFFNCHVFITKDFEGEPKSGREGIVKWFELNEIPFDQMWPDDKFWMHLLFKGKKFEGDFHFDESLNEVVDYKLKVI